MEVKRQCFEFVDKCLEKGSETSKRWKNVVSNILDRVEAQKIVQTTPYDAGPGTSSWVGRRESRDGPKGQGCEKCSHKRGSHHPWCSDRRFLKRLQEKSLKLGLDQMISNRITELQSHTSGQASQPASFENVVQTSVMMRATDLLQSGAVNSLHQMDTVIMCVYVSLSATSLPLPLSLSLSLSTYTYIYSESVQVYIYMYMYMFEYVHI